MDVTQLSDDELQNFLDESETTIQNLEEELADFRASIREQIMAIRADYDPALLEDQRRRHERRDPSLDQHIFGG